MGQVSDPEREEVFPDVYLTPVAYRRFFLYGYVDIYDHKER